VQERPIKALSHLQPLRIYTYLQQHQNKSILLIGHPPVKPTLRISKYPPSSNFIVALFVSNYYAEFGTTSAKTTVPKRATEVLWLASEIY
jgi:hypothetical protein